MAKRNWTEEQKERALALLKEGKSYYRTGKITGLSDTHLALKFPGYGKRPTKGGKGQWYLSPDEKEHVEQLIDEGLSLAEVAREAGVRVNTLYSRYPQYAYTKEQVGKVANWARHHHIEDGKV